MLIFVGFCVALLLVTVLALSPQPLTAHMLPNQDKLHHIAAFAVLQIFASLRFRANSLLAAGLLLAYAAGIEFIQSGIPGRTGSLADWLASAGGVVLIIMWQFGICRYQQHIKP
jgi:VanZ family protein